jgi:hypothetical protein
MAQTLTFGRESPYILLKAIEPNQREDTGLWLQNRKGGRNLPEIHHAAVRFDEIRDERLAILAAR